MRYRRPLIPCTLAYATGLWLIHDIYHTSPPTALIIGTTFAIAAIILTSIRRDTAPLLLILLTALGATVMASRERQFLATSQIISHLTASPGHLTITGTVRATAELADTEKSRIILTKVRITSGTTTHSIPGRVQLTAGLDTFPGRQLPAAGETITFPGRLSPPAALQNFFGYNRLEALRHEQVYATATPIALKGVIRTLPPSTTSTAAGFTGSLSSLRARLTKSLTSFRKNIAHNLTAHMWDREGRLMNAMLFNDMRSLTDEEREIFRNSGTFHLFAVSGMHVAILGFVLHLLFRALRFGPRASWIAVAVVLFLYLWIIDFVPSATRSYLMLFAFTSAYMLRREVDSLTALWFAIAVVIAVDPAALWKAGFILSVVGVASIILFTPLLRTWFPWPGSHSPDQYHSLPGKVMEGVMATVAVTIVMYPIQVYYFGFYNVLSPLANLLQAGLSSAILSAGVVSAVASLLSDSVGEIIGQSASLIMKIIFEISRLTARSEFAIFYYNQVPLWLMLGAYAVLASGYYLVYRDTPEFPFKARARFATHVVCGFGILTGYQAYTSAADNKLSIWCFDVGQGDSTLIRFSDGKTMLIDAGVPEPDMGRLVVTPQLRALGIHRLDYVVATHDDIDHTGGLASVIESTPVNYLLVPRSLITTNTLVELSGSTRNLLTAAHKRHAVIFPMVSGQKAKAGECQVEVLNPPPSSVSMSSKSVSDQPDNDQSIVLRITYGSFSALLMADASKAVEARLINESGSGLKPVTLLKVGHHGSNTGTSSEFLNAVNPKIALISCGASNRFNHPHPDLLHRLIHTGSTIYRTDQQGALHLTTDGQTVQTRTARN